MKNLGYILYQNKIYPYRASRENFNDIVQIDDGYCYQSVPKQECRVFIDAYMMAKYQQKWYVLSDKLNIENGKITLKGAYQNGFIFLYTDGGFPIYQKQIDFPDDLSDIILKVVEQKNHKRKRSFFQVPISKINWDSPNVICEILEMVFLYGLCPKVNITYNMIDN